MTRLECYEAIREHIDSLSRLNSAEIVEKLKRALASHDQKVRADALEEAAQNVENNQPIDCNWTWNRKKIADAIRALTSSASEKK